MGHILNNDVRVYCCVNNCGNIVENLVDNSDKHVKIMWALNIVTCQRYLCVPVIPGSPRDLFIEWTTGITQQYVDVYLTKRAVFGSCVI